MQKHSRKYWITVISKEHALRWIWGNFIQVCHWKKSPLARMKTWDFFLIYAPKVSLTSTEKYQKFIAVGEIIDDTIYQFQMTPDFCPFRRDVRFFDTQESSIIPLLPELSCIQDIKHWWYPFRFGILEIPEIDFEHISSTMWFIWNKK